MKNAKNEKDYREEDDREEPEAGASEPEGEAGEAPSRQLAAALRAENEGSCGSDGKIFSDLCGLRELPEADAT